MRLVHLSIASIAACLLGLIILAAVGLLSLDRMQRQQIEVRELLDLKARIDHLSVASDQLLLYHPDPGLMAAYAADARELKQRLTAFADDHPRARQAALHIEHLLSALETVHADGGPTAGDGVGPLGIPLRARIVLDEVAGHGIALDTALDGVLAEREARIARELTSTVTGLGLAALLFGALCVAAFHLIHRRLGGPVRALTTSIEQIRQGDRTVRVPVHGNDELTDLGHAFNDLLDEDHASREELRRYRRLVDSSSDLIAVKSADYRYVLVNEAYAGLYGLRPDEVIGRDIREMTGDERFEAEVRPIIDRCLAGESVTYEAERHYPGLGRRHLWIRYHPIPAPDGSIHEVGVVTSDITERVRIEAELEDRTRLMTIAGRAAHIGGWSVDLVTHEVEWSDMVARIHGMPPGHAPGVEAGINFYAPEHRERIHAAFTACMTDGTPYDEELQIITVGGERRWVRAIGVAVRDEAGAVVRVEGAFQDVTEEHQTRQRLEQYRELVERTSDLCSIVDFDTHYVMVNRAYAERYDLDRREIEGRPVREVVGAEFFNHKIWPRLQRALAGELQQFETERDHPRLGRRHILVRYIPITLPGANEPFVASIITDLTELHQMRQELVATNRQLEHALKTRQALINSLPAHIALLDGEGNVLDVNQQWRHFGQKHGNRDPEFGVGNNYLAICDHATGDCADDAGTAATGIRAVLAGERESFVLEYPCHGADEKAWYRMMASRVATPDEGGEDTGAVVMHVDITERKLAEQSLNRLAYEDTVTGVCTRNGFEAEFDEHIREHGWHPADMIVILDLEAHRNINDAHGYEIGDAVLAEVGRRLQEYAAPPGAVGRIGGDEFVVMLCAHDRNIETPDERCRRLARIFDRPFRIEQLPIEVKARFGYTLLGGDHRGCQQLLHEAELALYEARARGGHAWRAYTTDLDRKARRRIAMTGELRRALASDEFELHFQPKVNLVTGELIGCEALLRWHHPERGLVPPGLFIPVAEQSQLIGPIGDWTVHKACRMLREWRDAGLDIVRVAVNVSVVQFRLGHFTDKVREALATHDVAPEGLTLEITESVFEEESELLRRQLRELHELGVRLSLDDFGTGYSSLLYLQQYPFDEIKIDQGFVQHMVADDYSRKIVATVLGVAGALGADAIAEGIESAEVRDALLEMGCTVGQGYYYSAPLAAADFRRLLERHSPLPLAASDADEGRAG